MEKNALSPDKETVSNLLNLFAVGNKRLWVDYDKEADVLYVNFNEPSKADEAREERGIIKRTRNGKVVGLTVLHASDFASKKSKN